MAKRSKKREPRKLTRKELRHQHKNLRQQRQLLFGAGAVVVIIVLILGFGYYQENIAVARAPVAVVNGQAITTQEYQDMVNYRRFTLMTTLGAQLDQPTLVSFLQNQLPTATLDSMIDQVLIEQKAAEEGIEVTDQEVQEEIERQFGFTGEAPTPTAPAGEVITDTEAITDTAETVSPMTREEFETAFKNFLEALKAQTGLSEAQYRKILRGELLRDKVRERIVADVPATAPQVHARHILVETEEEAQAVRERLLNGEDFATVAKEVSTDPGSAQNGGDLGWFGLGRMVPEFEKVAFNEPIGEISEPVKTQFGYHIIEVLERDENRELSPSELEQAKQERFQEWLQEQRASADIQRHWTPEMVPPLPAALNAPAAPAPVSNP